MQIPAINSAASAAGISAQASSKQNSAAISNGTSAAAVASGQANVEKAGSANPDRDAQGQSDGQPHSREMIVDKNDLAPEEATPTSATETPFPTAPASQLDIVG